MKKILILLSIVVATSTYSAISTRLDVNATLIRPLAIETSSNDLQGSMSVSGGTVSLSTVDLTVTGLLNSDVKITAPKDVTLYNPNPTGTDTREIILQSVFTRAGSTSTTGTQTIAALRLDAQGEGSVTYSLTGTVPAISITGNTVDFVGNADVTVAYN